MSNNLPVPANGLDFDTFSGVVCEMAEQLGLPEELIFPFLDNVFAYVENGTVPSVTPTPTVATEGFDRDNATASSTLAYLRANIAMFKTKSPTHGWRVSDIGKIILGLDHHNTGKWVDGKNVGNRNWIADARDSLVAEGILVGFYVFQGNRYSTKSDLVDAGFNNNPNSVWRVFAKS